MDSSLGGLFGYFFFFLLITSKATVHDHMQGFCILTPRGTLDGWILSVSLPQAAKIVSSLASLFFHLDWQHGHVVYC